MLYIYVLSTIALRLSEDYLHSFITKKLNNLLVNCFDSYFVQLFSYIDNYSEVTSSRVVFFYLLKIKTACE